ncbi:NAD(P)-dependent alcohol dehydrogenase [Paraburkholderia silviterrae]|uniref:NAD(P)-dependent alcohol dehydrogenase n=1 Tax=Paraburkholderia silviterrae TaxID=2528715 RepID=A0A4R5M2X8_9BURK|nr:NAD(P)-dependent alcohol dehydrogenase [Paraburkholderia silviterrae]
MVWNCTCAVATEKAKPFQIRHLLLDEPQEGEIIVEIAGVGVCHTDLTVRDQHYPVPLPAVLGHEGAGIVVKVGASVTKVAVGDHVVLAYGSCGKCENCQSGKAGYCIEGFPRNFGARRGDGSSTYRSEEGESVGGYFFSQSSFGTYSLATERNVVKIDPSVPLDLMGPLGCGISTGAGTVLNALRPAAGSSIVVFGAGSVGLSAVMAAKLAGCATIIVVDIVESRLQLARELGATAAINARHPDGVDVVKAVAALTNGLGAEYSIESTANPKVLRQALECLRPTGVCALVGGAPFGTEATFDMNTILFGRTLRGVIQGDSVPDVFIPRLIELWKQGRFPFDKLVKFYALDEINEACADSESGRVLKPILRPNPHLVSA